MTGEELPKGPFTLWYRSDYGFSFEDHETLKDAIEAAAGKYVGSSWHISRPVNWLPVEASEAPDRDPMNPWNVKVVPFNG